MKSNWSLYEENEQLEPLKFSNGKTQEDIVNEVLNAISEGYKVIFIKGKCGTGKSGIALNIAKELGKTSIVVPVKSLQEQYIKDYTKGKYILKQGRKLKIQPIMGRKNFQCKYLKENNNQETPKETNSTLFNIYKPKKTLNDKTCDNSTLPCKIEIKEKNASTIKNYLQKNPFVKTTDFNSINEVKRMSIAPVCPYWSPIIKEEFEISRFRNANKINYTGLYNKKFTIYQREPGCPYYEQYTAYADADVIIFNSLKYQLETLMNRKPETEVELIDECDEFLDSFANQEQINLNRLITSLNFILPKESRHRALIEDLTFLTNKIKQKYLPSEEIYEIKDTPIKELLQTILSNQGFLEEIEIDESNYLFHLNEVALLFMDFFNETFFSIEQKDRDPIIHLVTTNLEKRFKELVDKNKALVMMSGTVHSEYVLRDIFGIENFKTIDAEIQDPGKLNLKKLGFEWDCRYENFKSGKVTKENYLKSFEKAIKLSKPPTLIHLTSFSDLPTEYEKNQYNLTILPTQQELINEQKQDPFGKRILEFKNKQTDILFTTKCTRGIDFPGDICNSIVISRFPYPNISSIFWKILRKTKPQYFRSFYMDKARRELLQRVYRGLRSKTDKIDLLSPDKRVLDFFNNLD